MKTNRFARFARAVFIFRHFADVLVLSTTWNGLFCSCMDDVSIWWQMFNFVFSCLKRCFQFNSRIVRTIRFASVMTLNNWETIAERRSYIFRWRSRCRRRRVWLSSLICKDNVDPTARMPRENFQSLHDYQFHVVWFVKCLLTNQISRRRLSITPGLQSHHLRKRETFLRFLQKSQQKKLYSYPINQSYQEIIRSFSSATNADVYNSLKPRSRMRWNPSPQRIPWKCYKWSKKPTKATSLLHPQKRTVICYDPVHLRTTRPQNLSQGRLPVHVAEKSYTLRRALFDFTTERKCPTADCAQSRTQIYA